VSLADEEADMSADQNRPATPALGVPPADLSREELLRELESLYTTRLEALRHGSDDALATHTRRTVELEEEYLRRRPEREIDPDRLREGARHR
jgi:hypothetical protein